jgi:DNA-binding MarR family transcriptional regulator
MQRSREQLMGAIDDLLRGIVCGYLKRQTPPQDHLDLTVGQLHCLHIITGLGTPTMSELAKTLDLRPSTVTSLVDNLVSRGLVARRPDPADRRLVRVEVTPVGVEHRERHHLLMRNRMLDLLSGLSEESLDRVHEGLATLYQAAHSKADATDICAGDAAAGEESANR